MLEELSDINEHMNVYVRTIGEETLSPEPDLSSQKLVVEDNIGESIHVHLRNVRIEMSIESYLEFADCIQQSRQRLENGNR